MSSKLISRLLESILAGVVITAMALIFIIIIIGCFYLSSKLFNELGPAILGVLIFFVIVTVTYFQDLKK